MFELEVRLCGVPHVHACCAPQVLHCCCCRIHQGVAGFRNSKVFQLFESAMLASPASDTRSHAVTNVALHHVLKLAAMGSVGCLRLQLTSNSSNSSCCCCCWYGLAAADSCKLHCKPTATSVAYMYDSAVVAILLDEEARLHKVTFAASCHSSFHLYVFPSTSIV